MIRFSHGANTAPARHEHGIGGLGDRKTDLLYWEMISLLDNNDYVPMRLIGQRIQHAARELWPPYGLAFVSDVLMM